MAKGFEERPLETPLPNKAVADVLRRLEKGKTHYMKMAHKYCAEDNRALYEHYKGKAYGMMAAADMLYEAGVRWREPLT